MVYASYGVYAIFAVSLSENKDGMLRPFNKNFQNYFKFLLTWSWLQVVGLYTRFQKSRIASSGQSDKNVRSDQNEQLYL